MWYAKDKPVSEREKLSQIALGKRAMESRDEHAHDLDKTPAKDFDGRVVLAHPGRGLL
jgi:hypothetical protein